jgi:hypothetical protein
VAQGSDAAVAGGLRRALPLFGPGSQLLGTYADGDEALALANFHGQSRIDSRLPGNAVVVSSDLLGDYFTRIADLDTVIVWSSARKFSSCGAWRFDHG